VAYWLGLLQIWSFLHVGTVTRGQEIISDFKTGNEGWLVVDAAFNGTNGVPVDSAIKAQDANPSLVNGKLAVKDAGLQWTWAIAPAKFLGDWRLRDFVQAEIVASPLPVLYPVMFWMSDGRNSTATNAAYHLFPLKMTVNGQTNTYTVSLTATNWVVTQGRWDSLLQNVREFWIRLDLTDGCSTCGAGQEINLLGPVVLHQGALPPLRISLSNGKAVLEWPGESAVSLRQSDNVPGNSWQTIPGTLGLSHYEQPISSDGAYFRTAR
jgi:hypothetical protein